MFFLTEGSTHEELVQMAQEDYNLDMNTKVVELTYSLPEAMMQQIAPDTPFIHVTSDRQVQNLIEITKTHYICLCVSSRGKFGNKEAENSYEVFEAESESEAKAEAEDSNGREEYEAGEKYDDNLHEDRKDGREKDVDIPYFDEDVDDAEDYNDYGKVKDEEEVEEDDMEGCTGISDNIYVNKSFVSKEALVSELWLTTVKKRFSYRIYKTTKTLLVAKCRVNGCVWKLRASVKHGANTFWVTKYVKDHTCSVTDWIAQRKRSALKYIASLFLDCVRTIDGLTLQHIKDAMKNMFDMNLDYTTSYRTLVHAQELVRGSIEDGYEQIRVLSQAPMSVQPIDRWRFFVKGGKRDCVVDLEHGKCDCGVFAIEKIPCPHAIAVTTFYGVDVVTLVSLHY
ncbi:hypothetical protein N665_1100s0011 [Sinapis alba]|nr:hypothetical protein N665_1100s0011 [Sinapis alba]